MNGRTGPCVQNNVCDVTVWQADVGVTLDGYSDTNKPCYWNNFARVLVAQPSLHGIHLTKSGAGDTPQCQPFSCVPGLFVVGGYCGGGDLCRARRVQQFVYRLRGECEGDGAGVFQDRGAGIEDIADQSFCRVQ